MKSENVSRAVAAKIAQAHGIVYASGALEVMQAAQMLLPRTFILVEKAKEATVGDDIHSPFIGLVREERLPSGIRCEIGVWVDVADYEKSRMRVSCSGTLRTGDPKDQTLGWAKNVSERLPVHPFRVEGTPTKTGEFRELLKDVITEIAPFFQNPQLALHEKN